jgi:ubiquinone/menaquinone biosynthesis C-methylase UbiE
MKIHDDIKKIIDGISVGTLCTSFINSNPAPSESIDTWLGLTHHLATKFTENDLKQFAANDISPIPEIREKYNQNNNFAFWLSGLIDYFKSVDVANKHGIDIKKYLDFGCASGRVIRHFAHQSNIKDIWGCDINEQYITWMMKNFPRNVKPIHTTTIPNIPIEDNYFDLITVFSVFTHISFFETTLICELRRVMKTGSIAIVTLQMENSFESWQKRCKSPHPGDYGKWILKNNEEFVSTSLKDKVVCIGPERTPYNSLIHHSTDYVYKTFGRYFEILEIIPYFHGEKGINDQSAVVLKKN